MKKKLGQMLPRIEWDFFAVPEDELRACCYWEYARESERIRAFCSADDSDFFPPTEMHPQIKGPDGRVTKSRRTRVNPFRALFAQELWTYALPVKLMLDRVFGKMPAPLKNAWMAVPRSFRQKVVNELRPYFAEEPCLTLLPFNRCSDMRDIGLADDTYHCAELDREKWNRKAQSSDRVGRLHRRTDYQGFPRMGY